MRAEHQQLEAEARDRFEALVNPGFSSQSTPLAEILTSAQNLRAASLPGELFNTLVEESHRLGARAVLFEVRGDAAWAAAERGFGAILSEQALRSLVVPLSVDTPFRQVFELGVDICGTPEVLSRNPNVLSRLKPEPLDSVLLLPIRVGAAVAAIFYADSGGSGELPEDALKLLSELAGAQLERLTAGTDKAREAAKNGSGPSE